MTDDPRPPALSSDETVARLLRLAPSAPPPSADRAARVRATVAAEWRGQVRQRRARRTLAATMAAAGAAASIALVITLMRSGGGPPAGGEIVATIERVDAAVRIGGAAPVGSPADPLAPPPHVRAGVWIETASGRASFRTIHEATARLDAGTRARWVSATAIELVAGAIYLDNHDAAPAVEIRTPMGTAVDVGTQFEVRVSADTLRVRVRTGAVAVRRGGDSFQAARGTELTVSARGANTRAIPPFGDEWEWISRASPPIVMEGSTLAAFLDRLARDNGWTVRYADQSLAHEAGRIILHGSVEGLSPQDALSVAATTAGLAARIVNGQAEIGKAE